MGHTHHSHPNIIKRLKRADGHLKKIITMIEDGKPCLEVAQQLQAVYKAVGNAKGKGRDGISPGHTQGRARVVPAAQQEPGTQLAALSPLGRLS